MCLKKQSASGNGKISVFPSRAFYSGREFRLKLAWACVQCLLNFICKVWQIYGWRIFCYSSPYSVYVYLCLFYEAISSSGNIRFIGIIVGEKCIGKPVPRWSNTLIWVTMTYFRRGGGLRTIIKWLSIWAGVWTQDFQSTKYQHFRNVRLFD